MVNYNPRPVVETIGRHAQGVATQRVYRYIIRHPGATRNEIAQGAAMPIQTVCGRVGDLRKAGLIYTGARRKDALTGIHNESLWPTRAASQTTLQAWEVTT